MSLVISYMQDKYDKPTIVCTRRHYINVMYSMIEGTGRNNVIDLFMMYGAGFSPAAMSRPIPYVIEQPIQFQFQGTC